MTKTKQQKFTDSLRQTQLNTFNDGLNMDLHPLTTPNTVLTDCVNGTMITYNDNEFVLQNDRGNTKIDDATLPLGYIPIAMDEYGGIIYIVSKNVDGNIEIGTFPSPKHSQSIEISKRPDITELITKIENHKILYSSELQYPLEYYWTEENKKISSPDEYSLFVPKLPRIIKLDHYTLDQNGNKEKIILQESKRTDTSHHIFSNTFDALLCYQFAPLQLTEVEIKDHTLNTLNTSELNCTFSIQSDDSQLLNALKNNKGNIKFYTKYYFESAEKNNKVDLLEFLNSLKFISSKLNNYSESNFLNRSVIETYWNKIPATMLEEYGDYFNICTKNLYFNDSITDFASYVQKREPFVPQIYLFDGENCASDSTYSIIWDKNKKKLTIDNIEYSSFVIEVVPVYESNDTNDDKYLVFDQHIKKISYNVGSIIHKPEWFSEFTYSATTAENNLNLDITAILDLDRYFDGISYDLSEINEQGLKDSTTVQLFELTEDGKLPSRKYVKSDAYIINSDTTINVKNKLTPIKVLTGNIPIVTKDAETVKHGSIIVEDNELRIKGINFNLSDVFEVISSEYTINGKIKIQYVDSSGNNKTFEEKVEGIEIFDRRIKFTANFDNIKKNAIYLFRIDFPGLGQFNRLSKDYVSFIVITTDYFLKLENESRFDKVLLSDWFNKTLFNFSLDERLIISKTIHSSNNSVYKENQLPLLRDKHADESGVEYDNYIFNEVQTYLKNKKDILLYEDVQNLDEECPYYKQETVSKIPLNCTVANSKGLYKNVCVDINTNIDTESKSKTIISKNIELNNINLEITSEIKKVGFKKGPNSFGIDDTFIKNYDRTYLDTIVNEKKIFELNEVVCKNVAAHELPAYRTNEFVASYKLSCENNRIGAIQGYSKLWDISDLTKDLVNILQSGCGQIDWGYWSKKWFTLRKLLQNENSYPFKYLTNKNNFNFLSTGKVTTGKHVGYTGPQDQNILWGIGITKENNRIPILYQHGVDDIKLKSDIDEFLTHYYIKTPCKNSRVISLHFVANESDTYYLTNDHPDKFFIDVNLNLYPKQSLFIQKYIQTYNIQSIDNLNINFAPQTKISSYITNNNTDVNEKYITFLKYLFKNVNDYFWTKEDLYDSNISNADTLYYISNDSKDVWVKDKNKRDINNITDSFSWKYDSLENNIVIEIANYEQEKWNVFEDINGCDLAKLYWNIEKSEYPFSTINDEGYKSIKYKKMYE